MGWLNHDGFDTDNFPENEHVYASDWLFVATPADLPQTEPVPEPTSMIVWAFLGTAGVVGASTRVRGKK